MLCLVFALRYLMQLQNEYSVMLLTCSRCGKVVILNVFEIGISAVPFLPAFKAVFLALITVQWRLPHTGIARVFDYDLHQRTRACLIHTFVKPTTVPLHFRLLTRALFFGPCHCSYISVTCLGFRVHVAGDLNKKYRS